MEDALTQSFRDFTSYARELGRYEDYSIDDLANRYCDAMDAGDEHGKNVYFSALVLRFWYTIGRMHQDNQTLNVTREDCYSWLTGAILMACSPDKRAWRANPKLGAQQSINQILATRFVAAAYYDSNLKKNKGKNAVLSLDMPVSEEGRTLGDGVADGESTPEEHANSAVGMIQEYIDRDKIVEAIIMDRIAEKDCFRHEKRQAERETEEGIERYQERTSEFWPFRLVKELNAIDDGYAAGFMGRYRVKESALAAAVECVRKASNQAKYRMVDATLADLRNAMAGGEVRSV